MRWPAIPLICSLLACSLLAGCCQPQDTNTVPASGEEATA